MTLDLLFAVAAPAAPQGWLDALKGGQMPFNWFDIVVVFILIVGYTRGRKHGMSEEMMYLIQWIAMIFGAAWLYIPGGDFIATTSPISHLASYIAAYITAGICIKIVFSIIKRLIGGKLIGSAIFGGAEYYLGMVAGILRFACIIIFVLALINARFYSAAEIKARTAYNTELYGSNFFPSLQEVQAEVFTKSFLGPQMKKHLDFLLIKPTPPEAAAVKRPGEWQWQ